MVNKCNFKIGYTHHIKLSATFLNLKLISEEIFDGGEDIKIYTITQFRGIWKGEIQWCLDHWKTHCSKCVGSQSEYFE